LAKLPKATISFVMPVRRYVLNYSSPAGRIFMKFGIRVFLETAEKITFSLKYDENNGFFT